MELDAWEAPVKVRVTAPVCDVVSPADGWTRMVRIAAPLPVAGDTVSHGWLAAAVQVTVPVPV